MDLELNGKRAAVAGSSSGLGLGVAKALAAAGCVVAVNGRDEDRLAAASADVPGSVALVGDVSTVAGAMTFVENAIDELGGVDILICNAGGPPPGTHATTPIDRYPAALEANLTASVALCTAALPGMRERGWGRILAITSISVRQPIATLILSNTARAGLTGYLKTLATEVGPDGITVNSLQPGFHATDRLRSAVGGDVDALAAQVPTRTVGDADDFGRVAAFLCSTSVRFITGAAIPVDGGAYGGLQ